MKRKCISLISFMATLILTFCVLVGCAPRGEVTGKIVETTDTLVVMQVEQTNGAATLFDLMAALQEEGEWSYTLSGTMIQSINGKENPADYSSCWMLYTSDTVMGNTEWGTYEYQGVAYPSAIVGGDTLRVIEGAYYIWEYKSFQQIKQAGTR